MRLSATIYLALLPLLAQSVTNATTVSHTVSEAALRARIEATPSLPFHGVQLAAKPPTRSWESGMVSWVAIDANGLIYEIQRGEKADPVIALDREGTVLRSWGKGDYTIPHSIRVDPLGNVWTVDAGSSVVRKYSPTGEKLLTIVVGGQPTTAGPFSGATDVAFAPDGHLYITDGYGNARILEYTADGKKIRQWGKPGSGPGEFKLPHSIQIDPDGTVYVADRENGRIQEFDLRGRFLREIPALGRTYSLKLAGDVLWAGMQPFEQPPGAAGWIVKFDRKTGKMLGHIDVTEPRGLHSVEQMPSGEPLTVLQDHLLWMRAN
jgi:DNA-binding beta-propeller fold protein YncE